MKLIILFTSLILITGCSAFEVHDKDKSSQKGVPFYIKSGIVEQTTTYTRSWVEAKIDYYKINGAEKVKGSNKSAKILLSQKQYDQIELLKSFAVADSVAQDGGFVAAITTLLSEIQNSCKNKINCEINTLQMIQETSPENKQPQILLQALESNTSKYKTIVNYDNIYYFNAVIPPFGTTTATIKLATDGTMTEATSTVDSTKLADSIPLKEQLIKRWGLQEVAEILNAAKNVKKVKDYSLTLSISIDGYKYNLIKHHTVDKGLNLAPLIFSTTGISIQKTKFQGQPKEKKKEEAKKAITISGTIVLPEEQKPNK